MNGHIFPFLLNKPSMFLDHLPYLTFTSTVGAGATAGTAGGVGNATGAVWSAASSSMKRQGHWNTLM